MTYELVRNCILLLVTESKWQWLKQIYFLFCCVKKLVIDQGWYGGWINSSEIWTPFIFLLRVLRWLLEVSHHVCIPGRKRRWGRGKGGAFFPDESFPY